MYNGNKISKLIEQRKIKKKDLIEALGWSGNTHLKQVIENDPRVSTIEKVADYFGVPIDEFFDRNVPINGGNNHVVGSGNNVSSIIVGDAQLRERVKGLEQLIEEKDKRIATLDEMVKLLRSQLNQQSL